MLSKKSASPNAFFGCKMETAFPGIHAFSAASPRRGGYQPPAASRNWAAGWMAGMNGFNVGVDAHIDPKPYATTLYVEWGEVK